MIENSRPDMMLSKKILARHGKSFYWASLFLGPKLAERAARLYQFCRFVDDLADGDLSERKESLEDIRARLEGHSVAAGPEIESFLQLASENHIPLTAARELLDGMLSDQTAVAFNSEAELLRYCHGVAGTVGLMMCRVLNCKDQRADSFAIDLGIAMQLTNIARDVLEDAKMERRYLPASWINVPASKISASNVACRAPVASAIKRVLDLAEEYYGSALVGIRLLPFRSRFSITVALRVYRQIGVLLQRRHLRWWDGRVYVPASEKVLLTLRSLLDLRPAAILNHNQRLHRDLKGLAGVVS
jgi:phytoene synthase